MKKQYGSLFVVFAVMAIAAILPEIANAQTAGSNITEMLTGGQVKPIIKFGLGMYAAWKWFEYFASFKPSSAFLDIILPAMMTFLAFKYDVVLGWFKITSLT